LLITSTPVNEMDEGHIDLKKLAQDAMREAYSPRAKKCWPWSHEWTMWALERHPLYVTLEVHRRQCLRCGKIRAKTKRLSCM
jgi:hypothetical protein